MPVYADGDTFLYGPAPSSLHLHIVLCGCTGPTGSVVIVTLNTVQQWTDNTVVLQPGDHPFINRNTAVSYRQVRVFDYTFLSQIEVAYQNVNPSISNFRRHTPVSPPLLDRIIQGALVSPLIAKGMKALIKLRLGLP